MSEISLYRKYRPQTFFDLIGQDHLTITIKNAVKENMVSHAYIFDGPRGTGKTSAARLVAKVLNCEKPTEEGEPCLKCNFCEETKSGRLIDLIEIDAASNRGIDEMRDLREKIKFLPTYGSKKIYIIDEVHMLTKEAFNALLKTLEEPPAHAHFILATTEIHKVPDTIISRCQRFDFKRISMENIISRLQYIAKEENIEADADALKIIAKNSGGCLRDAISLFEQMIQKGKITYAFIKTNLGYSTSQVIENFNDLLMQKNTKQLLAEIETLFNNGYDLSQFTKELIESLRIILLEKAKNNNLSEANDLIETINNFQEAGFHLKDALIPQLPVEMAIIKSCFKSKKTENLILPVEKEVIVQRIHQDIKPEIKKESYNRKPNTGMPLTEENIKANFSTILDNIKNPSTRRSFKEAKFLEIKNSEVIYGVDTLFHLEKIQKNINKEDISQAFEMIFGKGIILHFKETQITFTAQKENIINKKLPSETEKLDEATNSILNVFGGEVVE